MSIEDQGPDGSGRWKRRARDVHNGWVKEWTTRFAESEGIVNQMTPLGRWPFTCKKCGTDMHGFTPARLRGIRRNVEAVANSETEFFQKIGFRVSSTAKCCGPHRDAVLIYRLDGTPWDRTATLIDIQTTR